MTFQGTASQTNKVVVSSDVTLPLANWTVLTSGLFGASLVTFVDADAHNTPVRFYLLASP